MFSTKLVYLELLLLEVAVLYIFCFPSTTGILTTECEYYNSTTCNKSGKGCEGTKTCDPSGTDKRNHCYVLWKNNSNGEINVMFKGCFLNNAICHDQLQCIEKHEEPIGPRDKQNLFCCCEGDLCNHDFFWIPKPTVAAAPVTKKTPPNDNANIAIYAIITGVAVLAICSACFFVYRHRKPSDFNEIPTEECNSVPTPSPTLGLRPIQLLEVKARGRFGAVWKAQYKTDTVAVKIFPLQDKQSWLAEQEIYKLPHMGHDHILNFIGIEKRGDNINSEYWLITAFHEKGSLCDYLKANTVSWHELCQIAGSMASGLMHLHDEILSITTLGHKPAVAHRDFKSKNVLLKADLTACIADFGLALIFEPGKPCGDTHGQVGTRRYMAPEVLEGAIQFSRDSFLRIDIYACGLVLWELASRCSTQETETPPYMLPFELEIGQHPGLEDMQDCVVTKKKRPVLHDTWKVHPGMSSFCNTIEECWDQDAEARLSASCVVERILQQSHLMNMLIATSKPDVTLVQPHPIIINDLNDTLEMNLL